MTYQPDSNIKKIKKLEKDLNKLTDNLIFTPGVNDSAPSFSNFGGRNAAHGTQTGTDAVQPLVHLITNINDDGTISGLYNKINLIASNVVVDQIGVPNLTLKYILKTKNNGQRISALTVKAGKTLTIQAGGNIKTDSDITITDKDLSYLIYSEDITDEWRILTSGSKPPVNGEDPITLSYLNQVIQNIINANGLANASTIIEKLLETVIIGNGTQEYKDIGFIEPRTDSMLNDGTLSLIETVNVGNGMQEYKDIGFISETLTEIDPVMSLQDLFIQTVGSGHVGDSVGVVSTLPCLTPYFAGHTLTIKINGTTQGTVVAAVDGSFTLTFFIALGTPLGVGSITISDGSKTAINDFDVI